ncbi:MAG: hypothetical protein WBF45_00290 [Acidobacteriaceae bacterium]
MCLVETRGLPNDRRLATDQASNAMFVTAVSAPVTLGIGKESVTS